MEFSGEQLIAAPRETVWAALNDPDVLKTCIPGCESVEKISDTEFKAVTAGFSGTAMLSDLDPPNGYTISIADQGESAATPKASAEIRLADESGATKLTYRLTGEPDAASAATAFLTRVAAALATPLAEPISVAASPYHNLREDHDHDPSNPHYFGLPVGVLIAAAIAVISVTLVLLKFVA
jgi:carbon monoxide dehydrogenase subunit G